jgi:hypothetical protein
MGLIAATKRIAVELLKTMDDATKQNLILPLNALNEQVVNTINGQLSFTDNMTSKPGKQTFTDNVMSVIANPLGSRKANGIIPIDCSDRNGIKTMYITPQNDQKQIGVTVLYNTASITASVRFLVIAE